MAVSTQGDPSAMHYAALLSPATDRVVKDVDSKKLMASEDEKSKTRNEKKLLPFLELFCYADSTDKVLMAVGTFFAAGAGLAEPLQILLFGNVLNAFNPSSTMEPDEMRKAINSVALKFLLVGLAVFVCGFGQIACWSVTASRQAKRIRSGYVSAILSSEIGWFDVNDPMQLPTRVADCAITIQNGMGRKLGNGIHYLAMAVSGVFIGLIKGWELTLVLLAFTPFIAGTQYYSMNVLASATQTGIESYGKAGAIAQESLSNIRTVHMFNSISHFIRKYDEALQVSMTAGIRKSLAAGSSQGLVYLTMFCAYAAGIFYGAVKIADDRLEGNTCSGSSCYDGGRVLTVFFSVTMGAMALGQAGPSVQALVSARAAAYEVFAVINRKSLINPLEDTGRVLPKVAGHITIDNVSFAYPSRPDVQVCSNYSLTIEAGETVALVGPSGSGKSTVVSLLERFYDPLVGSVKLDGHNIRELNVQWLRSQVGLVGQEPVLFSTSILENIRHGAPGASDMDVYQAARMANAYGFIKEFPRGFNTEVGERGAQLSGGQKQRIAIARAIIKNPSILLLDEATSALDTESERIVQESLDKLLAASKRTTIIVAHRLSTIRNASRIAVHSDGSIVEIGTHDELMTISNGHYRLLVETQQRHIAKDREQPEPQPDNIPDTVHLMKQERLSRSSAHSKHREEAEDDTTGSEDVSLPKVSMARVWRMSFPEWKFLILGAIGAIMNAAIFPLWGVLLTKATVLYFQYNDTKHEMISDARYWSLDFIVLGVFFCASIMVQFYGFGVTAQRLVSRVRLTTYSAMMHQDVGWFDLDENTSGALVSQLATDSAILQAMTSDMLNQVLVNFTSLGIAFAIAFYYSWQMTLAVIGTAPIMGYVSYLQAQEYSGTGDGKQENYADSAAGSLLSEAIGSIRTVASFGMEKALNNSYVEYLGASKQADIREGLVGGGAYGFSLLFIFLNEAFMYWLGAILVTHGYITFEDMFMVSMVVMLSMFAAAMSSQNVADSGQAKKAARRIFQIIDRVPDIDATESSGQVLTSLKGDIELKGLEFAYPSRPDAKVYKNYNLKIANGTTVALVGASGSGKSTAIALLERFYDPSAGVVTLDGTDIRSLRLPWLRDHISLVSQEPVLFAGTIAENIALGKPGSTRKEVIDAAKKANAFDFISNFPDGFDTDVGDRGAQVSGGQKQRIAIARAILRDPQVLLLDEATSALDNESERIVQASLDHLLSLKKRTTVIVAHRLSTIRNADLIAVTHEGVIVEQGTHDQLMQDPNGIYYSLVARQLAAHN